MCRLFGVIEVVSGYKLSGISIVDNCAVVPFVHMMLNYRLCQIIFNQGHLIVFAIPCVYLFLYLEIMCIISHGTQEKYLSGP
jgi:hypothetical protein